MSIVKIFPPLQIINNYHMIWIKQFFLLSAFCFLVSLSLSAQLNLKVGYNLSFAQAQELDDVLSQFNEDNPWLDKRFKSFDIVNGLLLGFRYRFSSTALSANIYNRFKTLEASGTDPATNTAFFRKLSLKSRGISFGIEQFVGMISLGVTLDRDRFILESKNVSDGDFFGLIDVADWSNHIYVGINTPRSSGLALSIRPFVHIPWSSFSVDPLEENLGVSMSGRESKFWNFGVQVIFLNGSK